MLHFDPLSKMDPYFFPKRSIQSPFIALNALVFFFKKNIVISSIYRILLGPTPELDHPSLDRIHPKTVSSHVEENDSQTPGHVLLVSEMIDCSQSDCFFSIRLLEGERA